MPDMPPDFEPKIVKRPYHKGAKAEMEKALAHIRLGSRAWKTDRILAELEARDCDPGWFADCLAAMATKGSTRDRMRALELIQKFVIHQEGAKIQHGTLDEKTTDELQEAYDAMLRDLQKQGVLEEKK